MKTFLRTSIAFLIILFFVSSAYPTTKNDPRFTNENNPKGITYVVELDQTNMSGLCHTYRIILTDEDGLVIDEPKTVYEGITTYVFHEMGPVSGMRIANLEKVQNSSPYACNQSLYATPNAISNSFRNGATYLFYLSPGAIPVYIQ